MIESMKPNDVAMLIAFSDTASVVQSYTMDKIRLQERVDSIAQSHRQTNLADALKLASGLSNVGQTSDRQNQIDIQVAESLPATAIVLSDGGFASLPDTILGNLKVDYRPIGEFGPGANVGITACQMNPRKSVTDPCAIVRSFGERIEPKPRGRLVDFDQPPTVRRTKGRDGSRRR